jgi:hypothetical protein
MQLQKGEAVPVSSLKQDLSVAHLEKAAVLNHKPQTICRITRGPRQSAIPSHNGSPGGVFSLLSLCSVLGLTAIITTLQPKEPETINQKRFPTPDSRLSTPDSTKHWRYLFQQGFCFPDAFVFTEFFPFVFYTNVSFKA